MEIMPKLGEMGLLGVIFSEQYGGAGLGYIEYALAIEELARVDGSVGLIVAAHNSLCSNHIFKFGTDAQKKKYLVPLASGKAIGAWSLTEPEAGSDAGGTRTTAVRDGNHWVLNGAKTFTTHGHYANYCVAMAVTDKTKSSHWISEFQAVQFKLADMATQVEVARLLVYQAAWLADKKDVRFTRESSMAKLFASEIAVSVANECVQIHGGYGFIKDYPAEKYYRDVKLCTIGEGTSEIQKLVIARQLLGKK